MFLFSDLHHTCGEGVTSEEGFSLLRGSFTDQNISISSVSTLLRIERASVSRQTIHHAPGQHRSSLTIKVKIQVESQKKNYVHLNPLNPKNSHR